MFKNTSRLRVFSFFFIALFSSCNEEQEPNTIVVEKTIVESVDSAAIVKNDTVVAHMENDILGLASSNSENKKEISELHKEVKVLKTENDSLKTLVHLKNDVIAKLITPKQVTISKNELEIRALVQNLNTAWGKLIGAENSDAITSLFLPNYAVSMTSIGIDDKGDVRMMLPEEFVQYANKIRKLENTSLLVGNVNYIYFEGREDVYSIVYSAVLRIYKDNVAIEDKSMVATLTVKKVDNQWKIGKYSWVTMGNELK